MSDTGAKPLDEVVSPKTRSASSTMNSPPPPAEPPPDRHSDRGQSHNEKTEAGIEEPSEIADQNDLRAKPAKAVPGLTSACSREQLAAAMYQQSAQPNPEEAAKDASLARAPTRPKASTAAGTAKPDTATPAASANKQPAQISYHEQDKAQQNKDIKEERTC